METKVHKISKYFLLLLFLGYYGCISLLEHTHIIDGVVIVHSHPFSSSTSHQHSNTSVDAIQHLTHFDTVSNYSGVSFVSFLFLTAQFIIPGKYTATFAKTSEVHFLRPPPSFS